MTQNDRQQERNDQGVQPAHKIAISATSLHWATSLYWLEAQPVMLYALPIGPKDLVHAPPPLFGLAILVDQAGLSAQERAEYETLGVPAQPGLHWRFPDRIAQWIYTLYQENLTDIAAWRNTDETWDAYTLTLPATTDAHTIPFDVRDEKVPPLNKTQQQSVARIRLAAHTIEELVPLELKRQSQQRKHTLETMYASLTLHAHKLHLQVPALSTFYDPQQYLAHTRAIVEQLSPLPGESVSSGQQVSDAVLMIDPAVLPQLVPDLLAINERGRQKLQCELQVATKLHRLFDELDMAAVLQLTEEEHQVAYPLLEALYSRESSRIAEALEHLDKQRRVLLALQTEGSNGEKSV